MHILSFRKIFLLTIVGIFLGIAQASAAVIVVDEPIDDNSAINNGFCSLREAFVASNSDISVDIKTALLGIVIGGLFFSVIRHSLPMGKEGKPLFFIVGIVIYAPIIILSWSV